MLRGAPWASLTVGSMCAVRWHQRIIRTWDSSVPDGLGTGRPGAPIYGASSSATWISPAAGIAAVSGVPGLGERGCGEANQVDGALPYVVVFSYVVAFRRPSGPLADGLADVARLIRGRGQHHRIRPVLVRIR